MKTEELTKEDFRRLTNEERFALIQGLDFWLDRHKILELLLSVEMEELDANLLGELGKVYNNTGEYEAAMAVLDSVSEEERDAKWYYRYAYSHSELARNLHYDFETEVINSFQKLENALKITNDVEITRWCLELVSLSGFEKILEDKKESFPFLFEKYFEYMNEKNEKIEETIQLAKAQKKKITIEDIKKSDNSWDLCEPMFKAIIFYESYEQYLESTEGFTLEQRYLNAILGYFGEVYNGGHHQFFYNSTGMMWEDALNGFQLFGMQHFANNLQKVVEYFGGKISFDRKERWELLNELEEKYGNEFFAFLEEADDFVYADDGEAGELDYIKAHPEKFVFSPE